MANFKPDSVLCKLAVSFLHHFERVVIEVKTVFSLVECRVFRSCRICIGNCLSKLGYFLIYVVLIVVEVISHLDDVHVGQALSNFSIKAFQKLLFVGKKRVLVPRRKTTVLLRFP